MMECTKCGGNVVNGLYVEDCSTHEAFYCPNCEKFIDIPKKLVPVVTNYPSYPEGYE